MQLESKTGPTDVVVLGAGMAGLTAARALAESGVGVMVVEAREHVGGRVLSRRVEEGQVVELGADFVHGRAPELWALIDEAGVRTTERVGAMLREEWRNDPNGGGVVVDDPQDEAMFELLEQLEDFDREDVAFADWLAASDVPEDDRAALVGYVEGFNAADARKISARALGVQQKAENAIGGDRSWHIHGGYAQLAEYLAAKVRELNGEIRLGAEALAVRWREGEVVVKTTQGEIAARRCVITLPLSLMQRVNRQGGMRIEPEPAAIAHARRMAMGHATRFTMLFRERWWEQSSMFEKERLRAMSFLFTSRRMPPVWWTSFPGERETPAALTGWAGGPRARALEGKSAEELGRAACAVLAEVFAVEERVVRGALMSTHTHDWAGDPYTLGAYSYVPVGGLDASAAMAEPQAGTIFFAGEHTDTTGHWGTVHAAIRSGLRAARQVLGE